MNTIKLNHWYIHDNQLAIALMHFYVSIDILKKNDEICFLVKVINSDTVIKEIQFEFSSIENAISFVEDVVSKCWNFDEVISKFGEFYTENEKTYKKKR